MLGQKKQYLVLKRTLRSLLSLQKLIKKNDIDSRLNISVCKMSCTSNLPLGLKISSESLNLIHIILLIQQEIYILWNAGICPIASKVGHVTLAMPPFGVIHHPLYTTSSNGSNRENTKSLASAV